MPSPIAPEIVSMALPHYEAVGDPATLQALSQAARSVLLGNIRGTFIAPSKELYGAGNNNLGYSWDTAFSVMAIAEFDAPLARHLFDNYMAAQHDNGMVPHIVMWSSDFPIGTLATNLNWHGGRNLRTDLSGQRVKTSVATQPPMMTIAATTVMDKLATEQERHDFARQAYPKLLAYHAWLYGEREINDDGLLVTIHPHETGRDDAPSHIELLRAMPSSLRDRLWLSKPVQQLFEKNRSDGSKDLAERSDTDTVMRAASLAMFHLPVRLQRTQPDGPLRIHPDHPYQHFDTGFMAITDRANDALFELAEAAGQVVPEAMAAAAARTREGLQKFWSPAEQGFRGIDARGQVSLPANREIGDLMLLYSNHLTDEQVNTVLTLLEDERQFGGPHLPSVNRLSNYYDPDRFWQGADWPQIRQLMIDAALRRHHSRPQTVGHALGRATIIRALRTGQMHMPEYHDSLSGDPKGARGFSWAAGLVVHAVLLYEAQQALASA